MATADDNDSTHRESARLRILHDYHVLDTAPEPVFDELTELAAALCRTPISLVSLVDRHRQWFKSHRGLEVVETPRALSFCAHTIRRPGDTLVVSDARQDPRFADNPLVAAEGGIRFYAGAPLVSAEGQALGTLCVVDRQPRTLNADQLRGLQMLSRQVMAQLELRRTLRALKASEERFASVARAVSDVIWDWDLRTDALWWSEGFTTVFGYAREAVSPTIASWTDALHPDDRTRVVDGIHRAIAGGESAWADEYRFRRGDGTYATVSDRGQILRDPTGRAYRMVGGMSDLTERKQLESQHLRAQRMESIGALASGIAHDLNNVLTPVLISVSMLRDKLRYDAQALSNLHTLEVSAVRGAELVRQILSFARGIDGVRAPTDLRAVLLEALRLARETFPRSITIESQIPAGLHPVNGDATHLHQVFMNLLVNARDALPAGGVLEVTARNADLGSAVCAPFNQRAGRYVVATVRDNGVGIPAEIMDRIFEPFFSTKSTGHGSGLGLSTVHGIVTTHGGFVRVRSNVGAGAAFEVCLPAMQETARLAAAALPSSVPGGRGERILLVDDEWAIRSIAAQTLELHGYRVLTAEHGADALAMVAREHEALDLVLTDMMMPVMGGSALIDELRRIKPRVPIIAASGVPQYAATHLPPGLRHFLAKPYTAEALLKMVRRALDDAVGA